MQQLLEKSELRAGAGDRERLFDTGGAHSLDEVVSKLSRGLAVRGNAACLVCGATFVRTARADGSTAAECTDCGSRLE